MDDYILLLPCGLFLTTHLLGLGTPDVRLASRMDLRTVLEMAGRCQESIPLRVERKGERYVTECLRDDYRFHQINERQRQGGYAELLAMLIVLSVMLILAAGLIPNILTTIKVSNQVDAYKTLQVQSRSYIVQTQCLATPGCVPSAVQSTMIVPGTAPFEESGYVFTISAAGAPWQITAVPETSAEGFESYFVDATGVMRCNAGAGTVSAGSPSC